MKKYGKWIAVALLLSLVFAAVAVNYHKNGAERQNRLSLIYIPKVVDSRNDFWTSLIQGYGSHLLTLIQKKVFRRSQLPQTMWRQEKNLGNLRLLC